MLDTRKVLLERNLPLEKSMSALANTLLLTCMVLLTTPGFAQEDIDTDEPSIARQWTESLLFAIRRDLARPTVHARNLYHLSAAMFDSWAIYEPEVTSLFTTESSEYTDCNLINTFRQDAIQTGAVTELSAADKQLAQNQAVGMAAWTLLNHRFKDNKKNTQLLEQFRQTAIIQGLSSTELDLNDTFSAHNLGILVGLCIIANGLNDGSNEQKDYHNLDYTPANPPLDPTTPGNPGQVNPNRWQPLRLDIFVDQSGNETDTPEFLGADWGRVEPFALEAADKSEINIDGVDVPVWLDPGGPPLLGMTPRANRVYQLNHLAVALWSAQLEPSDVQSIDISPGALGNLPPLESFPDDQASILDQYSAEGGMVQGTGHAVNPSTSSPYEPNIVPLGDYTRVLAEFWADGPDSETPPGHWYDIYNEAVVTHADHERILGGLGPELDPLSYDVIVYLALGGALHDSAIAAWSVKRAYDYCRPITAIRHMASLGQSTSRELPNFHVQGVPLIPERIELVSTGDSLAGANDENVGKIKAYTWLGPDAIANPATDTAGVGWLLLENWWPYQRPTFVTPPFAGFVSGHSTFSRAAAQVLTAATGDAFFPGGMAEFVAPKNDFLVFEQGPSVDIKLQWATYRDAADQTSLSRIWGGIHPPADDLPGRKMGEIIGIKAWSKVTKLIAQAYPDVAPEAEQTNYEVTDIVKPRPRFLGGCNIDASGNHLMLLLLILLACTKQLLRRSAHVNKYNIALSWGFLINNS